MSDEKFECDVCEKSFDTKRGLGVHKTKSHEDVVDKKDDLEIIKLLEKGSKTVDEIADELNKSKDRVEERINKLMEKEWVQKQVESGKEMFSTAAEVGEDVVLPLMKDIFEETKEFYEGVSEVFKKRLGPKLPKLHIEWPEKEEEEE